MNAAVIVLTNYYRQMNITPPAPTILALGALVSTFAGGTQNIASGSANGVGTNATFNGPRGMSISNGILYVGDYTNNLIRQVVLSSATSTTIAGGAGGTTAGSNNATGTNATFSAPFKPVADGSGNLFICDFTNNLIRQMVIATGVVTTLAGTTLAGSANGTGTNASFSGPVGICYDGSGNLFVGDSVNMKIRQIVISTAVVSTLAGSGGGGYANGVGTNATFGAPYGITYTNGFLYVADYSNNMIRSINISTATVSTLAGGGLTNGASKYNGIGSSAYFTNPTDVAADTSGNLFVVDYANKQIRQIVISSAVVTTVAGGGSYNGTLAGSANGTGTMATFNNPYGIIVDTSGNLFVGDTGNNLIRQIVIATGVVTTFMGGGLTLGSNNGTTTGFINAQGITATFSNPQGITTDSSGNVYIADAGNNQIRMITPTGLTTTIAGGTQQATSGYTNSIGTSAQFSAPACAYPDTSGNLFVSDATNNLIRQITLSSGIVSFFAGGGSITGTTAALTNGTGTAAQFSSPAGSCLVNDILYIADSANSAIRQIVLSTVAATTVWNVSGYQPYDITTDGSGNLYFTIFTNASTIYYIYKYNISTTTATILAGNAIAGVVNGVGTNATFNKPAGITYYNGSLYIADSTNNVIRKLDLSTNTVTTFAGNGVALLNNGTGTMASFSGLIGIVSDGLGNLFVGDYANNCIRQVVVATGVVTTIAGSLLGTTSGCVNGVGTNSSWNGPRLIKYDGSGNLFVGDSTNNLVRKVVISTGMVSTVAGGGGLTNTAGNVYGYGITAQFAGLNSIVADSSGNLFVGQTTNNCISKINVSTGAVTTLAGGANGTSTGFNNGSSTAALFSTTTINNILIQNGIMYVADGTNNMIRTVNLSTGVVDTLAGQPTAGTVNNVGTLAKFQNPFGICADTSGNLFVTDNGLGVLRKIVLATQTVSTVASGFTFPGGIIYDGSGNVYFSNRGRNTIIKTVIASGTSSVFIGQDGVSGSANGTGTNATLWGPNGLVPDNSGNVFIHDSSNNLVRKLVLSTGVVSTVVSITGVQGITTDYVGNLYALTSSSTIKIISIASGTNAVFAGGGAIGGSGVCGIGQNATLTSSTANFSIGNDSSGNIYAATSTGILYKVTPIDAIVTRIAGGGAMNGTTAGFALGVGTNAMFSAPRVGCIDTAGYLYVCDTTNNLIKKIYVPTGEVSLVAGGGSLGGNVTGNGNLSLFNNPRGVTYYNGYLYISDAANCLIKRYNFSTGLTTVFAGGQGGTTGGTTDGTGILALMNYPAQSVADNSGNIYYIENNNYIVRKLDLSTGAVTTLAGQVTISGRANGVGTNATFSNPVGIAYDGSGNLYIGDTSNSLIRKVVIATATVTTLAGGSSAGYANSVGTNASFNAPNGLCCYGGYLYVCDGGNNLIRQINLNTAVVTTLAGGITGGTGTGFVLVGPGPNGGGINTLGNPMNNAYSDNSGNLYIYSSNAAYIIKMSMATGQSVILAGQIGSGTTNGVGTNATFKIPQPQCLDASGNLYICDNNMIRQININSATVSTIAGQAGVASIANGTGTNATFLAANPVVAYYNGNLYVGDTYTLRQITLPGAVVTTLAGQAGSGTVVGVGTNATFGLMYGITPDGSGNLYISDYSYHYIHRFIIASSYSYNLIGRVSITGVANGVGTNATFNKPTTSVFYNGFLYVADSGNGGVRKINVQLASSTTLAGNLSFAGTANGVGTNASFGLSGLTVAGYDNSGNIYILDVTNRNIRKINTTTSIVSTFAGGGALVPAPASGFADGQGYNALFSAPYVSADTSGNIYISDQNTIRKGIMTTSLITTVAGGLGYTTSGFANGTGTNATFSGNSGSCIDTSGNLFICDTSNYSIRQMVIATGVVTTLAGTGSTGSADATGTNASFASPNAICYDGSGNLFVADTGNNKIRQIVISTGVVTTLAGSGSLGFANATGTNATFKGPQGIMIDPSGNLFVCDTTNNLIRQIVISTAVVTTLAGQTTAGHADGIGTNATFNGVNTGTYYNDSLFVTDTANYLIRRIVISTATTSTLIGTWNVSGRTNSVGTNATIGTTATMCPDGSGNLFFGDTGNRTVRMINIATATVANFAGGGGSNASGYKDDTYQYSLFNQPYTIITDSSGTFYVGDYNNQALRVLSNGIVTTLAGNGLGGYRDDVGTSAQFWNITHMTTDNSGYLYTTDMTNNAIRKITIATGAVRTIVGGCGRLSGTTNSTYNASLFNGPTSCCLDGSGNLFVADKANNLIRKIVLATGVTTTVAGGLGATTAGFLNGIGTNASFSGPTNIQYNGGYLYVADATTHLIRQITIATGNVTTLAGGSGGWNPTVGGYSDGTGVGSLFVSGVNHPMFNDSSGNIYVTGSGDNTIRMINIATGAVSTLAGRPLTTGSYTDGVGTNAIMLPYNGAADTSGNIWFTETGSSGYYLRKVVIATGTVSTFMGNGLNAYQYSGTGTNFGVGLFPFAFDGSGYMYAYGPANIYQVYQVNIATATATVLVGGLGTGAAGHADGVGTNATFANLQSATSDGSGNLYICDGAPNNMIRKVVINTATVTTIAGRYNIGAYTNAVGTNATFNSPTGITYYQGNLFINEFANRVVRQLNLSTSAVTTLAGGGSVGGTSAGYANGVGTNATFTTLGVTPVVDFSGNLYISDQTIIRRINIATANVSIFVGGGGSNVASRSNATSYLAGFNAPASLAVGSNALYVADATNNIIRMIV